MTETTQKSVARRKIFLTVLVGSAILALFLFAVAFREIGLVSLKKLAIQLFGSDGPEWNAEEIAEYLNVPFPKDASDVNYASYLGRGGFIKLSFKAPPASATAFSDPLCYSVLHQGYDPFNAHDDGGADTPKAFLTQTDVAYYYYSYSPSAPKTYFGNRCLDNSGRIYQILVDKTDASLYSVSFYDGFNCNDKTYPIPCSGRYIVPYHQGSLSVNAAPQPVEPSPGEQFDWDVAVTPSTHYEADVTLITPKSIAPDENVLHLMAVPQFENCDGCRADIHGPASSSGLKLAFVGSTKGMSTLSIFWFGDPGTCTVQVHEVKD